MRELRTVSISVVLKVSSGVGEGNVCLWGPSTFQLYQLYVHRKFRGKKQHDLLREEISCVCFWNKSQSAACFLYLRKSETSD